MSFAHTVYYHIHAITWAWYRWTLSVIGRSPSAKVVILPCEPWSVVGSRGDEAMITAIIQQERRRDPATEVVILTGTPDFGSTPDGRRLAETFGCRFVYAWRPRLILRNLVRAIAAEYPRAFYALGADCMDGQYSPTTSLLLLAATDCTARMGIPARLTGFSFNDHPTACLRSVFRHASFLLLVRDPVSFARFEQFISPRATSHEPQATSHQPPATSHEPPASSPTFEPPATSHEPPAILVADIAFLMEPWESETTKRLGAWADAQRQAGRKVLGFNLHAMLYKNAAEREVALKAVAGQVGAFLAAHDDVALMLIPHDYRNGGDLGCLKPIYEILTQRHEGHEGGLEPGAWSMERIRLVSDELSAPELKALCGHLDCLFTSRMHLAIAALGMGKPVAAFAYQGKFAGLFRHFDLPENLLLPPDRDVLPMLELLMNHRNELVAKISFRCPDVLAYARENICKIM